MKQISVSTPGKIHLLGEHAVVYGKPALLTAIDSHCTVHLTPTQKTEIILIDKKLQKKITISPEMIITKTKNAQKIWRKYSLENNVSILKSLTENEMDYPIIAIGETLLYYKQNLVTGFTLTIDSSLPIGAGLGSSAALAVSVVAAVATFLDANVNLNTINDIAFLVEQKRHGLPSGADNSIVCFGGLVWFRKESVDLKIVQSVPFTLSQKLAQNFLLIDTGKPLESTGEMVQHVQTLYQKKSEVVERFLQDQELATRGLLTAIKNGQEELLMQLITKGEKNLEEIGVVSSLAKSLIRKIEKLGGAAKICGAGGIKKGAGVLLAYHQQKDILETVAKEDNLPYYSVTLGAKGIKIKVIK